MNTGDQRSSEEARSQQRAMEIVRAVIKEEVMNFQGSRGHRRRWKGEKQDRHDSDIVGMYAMLKNLRFKIKKR